MFGSTDWRLTDNAVLGVQMSWLALLAPKLLLTHGCLKLNSIRASARAAEQVFPTTNKAGMINLPAKAERTTPQRELMRRELVRLNYKESTIETYISWVADFAKFHHKSPDTLNESDIRCWLSYLANDRHVAWSTQCQAMNAVVCYYREILHRELGDFGQFTLASKPKRLPVIIAKNRVIELLNEIQGEENRLVCRILYSAGLRINEALDLRIQEVNFDRKTILIREPKHNHDRLTILADCVIPDLKKHLDRVRRQHAIDLADGFGRVSMPNALDRKYPNADRQIGWQWVFPAKQFSIDPKDGRRKRYHIFDNTIQKAVQRAVARLAIDQHFTPHSFRHHFGTHLYESGVDILKIKELMGHKDIATTAIYIHLARKPGETIKSPLD